QAVALSADEVNLSWTLNIANRGTKPVSLSDIRCVASLEGIDYRYEPATVSALLPSGGSVQLPCSVVAAMPAPQSVAMDAADWSEEHAIAPWSMHALTDISEGSKLRTLDCYAQSTAPRIGKPVFELVSIVISQDDIINTKLLLGLSIRNPNAFPISLSLFSYDLYGEKKHWASGKLSAASEIPAFGTRVVNLELVMNFTQMNRAILDQVLRMDKVNYRLSGSASVDMQRIPPYTQAYDLSGSTTVQR
ncbi:MAG TPA: LEA type 2 family protein, partial [Spirochaetales bacterium]|nr:LEA type 2 family protein [Spirochaetales bacterium]